MDKEIVTITSVCLPFLNDTLSLRIYCCDLGGKVTALPAPVVVLCHGFCGVQALLLPDIASAFARAGYVAVTFDYRGFGESTGEKGRLTAARQQEDIRAVLNWVQSNPLLNEDRIGLWGTSLGAVHAVMVAANNPLVKCIVSQMPFADGFTLLVAEMGEDECANFLASLHAMETRRRITGRELWVSPTKLLKGESSIAFFHRYKDEHPAIATHIPMLTALDMLNTRPYLFAGKVTQPTLVTLAGRDEINPPAQGKQLYEALAGFRSLHVIDDAGHYDLYTPPYRETVIETQLDWLRTYL